MNLTLLSIYLDDSQLEYIITISNYLAQEFFNFNFEYYDSQSNFAAMHRVETFPTFFLLKDGHIVEAFQGKFEYNELRNKLLSASYVQNNS
jgi:hypothetical protein